MEHPFWIFLVSVSGYTINNRLTSPGKFVINLKRKDSSLFNISHEPIPCNPVTRKCV